MSHDSAPGWQPATRVVALGRPDPAPGSPLGPPVTFTSTYAAGAPVTYARAGNPSWTAFEEALGSLEGGDALLFSSGMAAVSAALTLVPAGATIVAPMGAYSGVVAALLARDQAGSATVRWVDIADTAAVLAAIPGADLLWLESPTNPLLDVADLPALAAAGRREGLISVCDNTFATPLLQRPLESGVDVIVHSVTKYLSGHSDVILGACVTPSTERGARHADALLTARTLGGSIAGPMEAWLALRGLRTFKVRHDQACRNAAILASRLGRHAGVERVRFPGFGAMISIEVPGGAEAAERVCAASSLIRHSTSLGGVESQWERRREHAAEPATTPENLIRISVGIEDVEDLWADMSSALGVDRSS